MRRTTIIDPATGRELRVMAWRVEPRAVVQGLMDGRLRHAQDLGLALLSDDATVCAMAESEGGDSAANNLALRVFEHALDWGLGLAALGYIARMVKASRRLPKPFEVAVTARGEVYVVTATGRVVGRGA